MFDAYPRVSIVLSWVLKLYFENLNDEKLSWTTVVNSLSASLLHSIFLSFEVGIAHAIANFK